ncbi:hypothetical protein PHYBOEH_007889 [Phytophthora boehmeriae]|uniref:PX domain-containing protein n=1 Tax=Phytophthora boehmeriae TaxID=109152 RepID=A0A8T1W387_9STRA|nr:hypothetical protein PHYBOEH_007889 [Phytophthora boehmeriae]
MRLLQWLLAFSLLLVGVRYSWATLLLLRGAGWIAGRLLHLCVLLVGSGSFWWVLRSYQLQKEQELLDHALLKFKYYSRYRTRTGSNSMEVSNGPRSSSNEDFPKAASVSSNVSMMDAGFHLRVLKRLPVVAYLRTSWSLPPEICEEIAALAQLIVQDYVSYWFQSISPNEGFPNDVRFLLADLLGAVASRVLEIDSSQALTMVSKSLELLRLHLGWFREAYAQLADEYPSVFEGDEHDSNLLKRQEYIKAFAHRSQFLHPGVVSGLSCSSHTTIASPIPAGSSSGKKNASENAEASYLRHVATQLLTQLKPQFGQQCDTNVFVSVAMNLLREITAFKILKPLTEYSQPRYANEVVLSCLQAFADEKDPQSSPISLGSNGMMPTLTLNKLRTTSSFLYKASKRSGVQAEAAFQAMVDAVASAASSAAVGAAELVMEGDEWVDSGSNPFAFGSAVFTANSGGEKKAIPSLFATDDRISVTKAAKMMNPRGFIPGSLLSHKMTGENSRISTHMDDLKNAKANIGSSLNSSIGKVKNRLRTLGSHQMDPLSTPPLSTGAAARMIRKPGQLLQKAWKRGESGVSSPTSSFDDGAATPNSARSRGHSDANSISSLNPLLSPLGDDQEGSTPRTASRAAKMVAVRDRVVQHLEKAVASYTKMYDECSEMHNSARSRELYELLLAIEDTVMLGFRNQDSTTLSSEESEDKDNEEPRTPPLSPNVRRRSSLPLTRIEVMSPRRDSTGTERGSESDWEVNDNQYYWEYLARDRPASNGLGKAQKLKQRFNALKRGKKDTMEATKMTLLKRRSQSFDKDFPGSPGTNSSLAVFEADDTPATSTKTSAFTKARASIPSLRRGTSNKSMKSTVDAQELTAAPSMDDDDVVYFNGDDDDDNLCFRCLKALPASKSGVGSCQSCHQRVCISCLNFFAFMVYPPPLETSKKTRVCGNCYDRLVSKYKLRIEAHVGKYLIKDRERELSDLYNSATSSSTTTISSTYGSPQNGVSLTRDDTPENTDGSASIGQPVNMSSLTVGRATGSTKFEITVKVKDGCAYAWSVIKTFHDFEVLEKHLAEKMKQQEKKFGVGCQSCHWRGVDYMEMVSVKPSLKTVAATTLSYEKRLQVLEHFLQQLLACDTLCQSSIVQKFLLLANAYGTSVTADSSRWETGEYATSLSVASSMGAGAISSAGGISGTNGVLVENGKWRKGRWIAPDANSKETKMRVLQSIEVSLFSVLGELFEFDGIGLVRRQIFSMTRSFIKAFLGASHFRMLERQFLSFTDPKNLSGWIGDLRAYIFPDPSVADAVAASPPAPDMQELRKDCLEAILASFPSKALSLFGDTPCQNAALKLHEFLQHEVFVKNLLFSITDELLLHLFPDSTTFKGKKGSATTPAAPAAATKGVDETSAEVPASATP